MVAHVISDYHENPAGNVDPSTGQIRMTSVYDRHTKDSLGNTLASYNVARSSGAQGMLLNADQKRFMKEMCNWSQFSGQDPSPPDKSMYQSGCGDGLCAPNENSVNCPKDCGSSANPNMNLCQWLGGPEDAKICGGACPNDKVCNMGGKNGKDCGCHYCGNGVKDHGEECESDKDCPTHVDTTVTCVNCKCIYKASH